MALTILSMLVLSGCGDEGVAEDATVSVYVSGPLCAEAKKELGRSGLKRADELRVRAVCVDDAGAGDASGESPLAAIGAAARRATEDSSSIAYIGAPDPTAIRFSTPILSEAGIPRITTSSGRAAANRLLRALERAGDAGSLRQAVSEELR